LFSENHAVYEIMWKNIVEAGGPRMTKRHMRIACWTPEADCLQIWEPQTPGILRACPGL